MMRRLHSQQGGFTLVELLLASTIGLLLLGSATLIAIGAGRHNNEVASRTFANQRGRLAMERMIRLLRSQVCVPGKATTIQSATPTSISFYADLNGGSSPTLHTFTFNPTPRTITTSAQPVATPSTTVNDTLATDVVQSTNGSAVFRYYSFPSSVPASGPYTADQELVPGAGGLNDAQRAAVSRVDVDFTVTGELRSTRNIRAEMTDQAFTRLADPNRANPNPTCS